MSSTPKISKVMANKGLTFQECNDIVKAYRKGQFGVCVVAITSCDNKFLAAGKRIYGGRVEKVTLITNARLGCKFESFVGAKKDESADYQVAPLRGMTWVDYPYFKESNKTGKIYLSLNYRPCDKTKFESYYLLDGKRMSAAEVADMEQYMSKSSGYSKKQAAAGIADENEQTKVVQYCIEDIAYIGNNKSVATDIFEKN